jgi:hypothetical protein
MFAHCNVDELNKEVSSYVTCKVKSKNVGKPILPCTFGESSHYGLSYLGTIVNAIPYEFCMEIQDKLEPDKFGDTDTTIMLDDKYLRILVGKIKNACICVGSHMFPIDFVLMDMPSDYSCPILFGRTFLRAVGAIISCKEETFILKFGEERMKFHFSKFQYKPNREEIKNQEKDKGILSPSCVLWYIN